MSVDRLRVLDEVSVGRAGPLHRCFMDRAHDGQLLNTIRIGRPPSAAVALVGSGPALGSGFARVAHGLSGNAADEFSVATRSGGALVLLGVAVLIGRTGVGHVRSMGTSSSVRSLCRECPRPVTSDRFDGKWHTS
jgi:hypothetical protein